MLINHSFLVQISSNFDRKAVLGSSFDILNLSSNLIPPSGIRNILQVTIEDKGVLGTLLIMLETLNLASKVGIPFKDDLQHIKNESVLQVSNQEPSMSSKYPHEGPPILDTSNKVINMKLSGYLPWGQTRSSMT